jgi:type I restriction-modification system DNA methylase subunit
MRISQHIVIGFFFKQATGIDKLDAALGFVFRQHQNIHSNDFAFVLHALSYLSNRGRAAIVCFPGIFYRGGAEQKIRKYLIDNNYVETIETRTRQRIRRFSCYRIVPQSA